MSQSKMTGNKETKALLKKCREQGCRIMKGNNHIKVYCPDGKSVVVVSVSASDHRAIYQQRATLRRAGVKV